VENLRKARATDAYTLKGEGMEIFQPRFTYHAFRYVEITGFPGTPRLDTIRAKVVHTNVHPTGNFAASKQILNDVQRIILWGTKTNLHSIPTDCDQRDERMGWMGDAHLAAETAMWNFDMAAFYVNYLRDIADDQGEDGSLTDTVPFKWGRRPADPAWGAAYPLIAYYMYKHYGDTRVFEEHFEGLKAWTDLQTRESENGITKLGHYGDWVPIYKAPVAVSSSFYHAYSADITAMAARVLGKTAEAEKYEQLGKDIRTAFQREFWDEKHRWVANGHQGSQVFAMYLNMLGEERSRGLWGRLRESILYEQNTHLTTGILSTKYVMELMGQRQLDLAYDIAVQTTFPSWGYMIENGATTVWELWQDKRGPSMNSHNHPMYGSVGSFSFEYLAGLRISDENPGFRRFEVRPGMTRDLKWASGSTDSIRGHVSSSWRRDADGYSVDIDVPVGSEAEVHLPKGVLLDLELAESGEVFWSKGESTGQVTGVRDFREEENRFVLVCGSGRYRFAVTGR
jgi:alpha-L-rhamnosidase